MCDIILPSLSLDNDHFRLEQDVATTAKIPSVGSFPSIGVLSLAMCYIGIAPINEVFT
jgi:hypothetical protein